MAATPEKDAKPLSRTRSGSKRDNSDEAVRCATDDGKKIALRRSARNLPKKRKIDNVDLFVSLQSIVGSQYCSPERRQRATHFSALPPEIIQYIMRWVVSSNLDVNSLEQCAAVCRGWYLLARSSDAWRRSCSKFWPSNVNDLVAYNGSWRQMFIERPNVFTTGCYVGLVTYIRSIPTDGSDPALQDDNYRYLRFFADGQVLMTVSNSPPSTVVCKLQSIEAIDSKIVCLGSYKLSGDLLFLKLQDKNIARNFDNNRANPELVDGFKPSYEIVLRILQDRSKRELECIKFLVKLVNIDNKVSVTHMLMSFNLIPSFSFLRVKSYADESESIL